MKIKKNNNSVLTIIGLVMILIAYSTYPASSKDKINTAGYLEIFGKVKNNNKAYKNATIIVYCDSVKQEEYKSGAKGKFDIKLALNRTYFLHISGEGMMTKVIQINTAIPDSSLQYDEYEYKFNVNLMRGNEADDKTVKPDKPAVKLIYNKDYDGFDYDRGYDREMRYQITASRKFQGTTIHGSL